MKEQFVTYEIALKLKELGFDEECFGEYNDSKRLLIYYPNECFYGCCEIKDYSGAIAEYQDILAPLFQQAIDWLREKYKIDIYPEPTYSLTEYSFKVITVHGKSKKQEYWDGMGKTYNTYQEAREQAILKAIEILELPKD